MTMGYDGSAPRFDASGLPHLEMPGGELAGVDLPTAEPAMSGHPAVDAAIRSMANAADLSPADQIAEYEAAHRTLQETLATIDQA